MLKTSVRNSKFIVSETRNFFARIKSTCLKLGPESALRGKSPNSPGAGVANAAGLIKLRSLFKYGLTPATRFGRRILRDAPPPGVLTTATKPVGNAGKLPPKVGRLA